jgi:hypothetical protein
MNTVLASTEPCTLAAGYNYKLLQRFQRCSAISLLELIEKVREDLFAKFFMCALRL